MAVENSNTICSMRQKVEIQLYHIYMAEYFISLRKKYSMKNAQAHEQNKGSA